MPEMNVKTKTGTYRTGKVRSATFQISQAVTATESLSELFSQIHRIVAGLMKAENFYIALKDEKKNLISFPYFVDELDSTPLPKLPGRGLTEYVLRSGAPLLASPDVFEDLVRSGDVERVGQDSVDWLGVPLKAQGRPYGVLAVQSYSSCDRYTQDDLDILRFVADQIGLAIERKQAVEALRQNEVRHRAILRAIPDLLFVISRTGHFIDVHAPRQNELLVEPEGITGRHFSELLPPRLSSRMEPALHECLQTGVMVSYEYDLRIQGVRGYFEARLVPYDQDAVLALVRNITDRKISELVLGLLHEVDRMIVGHEPLNRVLNFVCEEIVNRLEYPLAWVGMKEKDGSVRPVARAGVSAGYLDNIKIRWDNSLQGQGPAGRAIRTGQPHVVDEINFETFDRYSSVARDWNFSSIVAFPLISHKDPFGVLMVYSSRRGEFSAGLQNLLLRFADQLALSFIEGEHLERIRLQNAALESAANAVMITTSEGQIEWVNPAFTELTGYELAEIKGSTPRTLKSGIHSDQFYSRLWETVKSGQVWRGELYNRRKDGTIYVEEQTVTPVKSDEGEISHFVSIKQDVTARRKSEERIRYLALHDPLTDLPNRRVMEDTIERLIAACRRDGRPSVLILLDLDNFKTINDSMGHPAGDRILIDLTKILKGALRPGDQIARFGGDEFVVLLEGASPEAGRITAERLLQVVSQHSFQAEGRVFDLTISLGVVPIDGRLEGPSIIALADAALYTSKEAGRNRVTFLDSDASKLSAFSQESQWATRIKHALENGRFRLAFQPIVRLSDRIPLYYEALIRLQDQAGEPIAPGAFLGAAERFGLMPRIDCWVVRQALGILSAHPATRLFINISKASFVPDVLDEIADAIKENGVAPGQLGFEITESSAVLDAGAIRQGMRQLKELGCGFALDDFGTAFSSFSCLQSLPADFVKIDGGIIRDLDSNPANRALVKAIDTVAVTMGKETIAEAVEDANLVPVLLDLGVFLGQGYGLFKPSYGFPLLQG